METRKNTESQFHQIWSNLPSRTRCSYKTFSNHKLNTLQLHPHLVGLFKRKYKDEEDLECKICHLKFSDPERTMRHMVKAHSKPQKRKRMGTGKYG